MPSGSADILLTFSDMADFVIKRFFKGYDRKHTDKGVWHQT